MSVRIRALKVSDYDDVVALWKRGGMKHEPRLRDSRKGIARQIRMNPGLFLAAFEGKKMIGVLLTTYDGRRSWLNRACVDPICRRKGIAKGLIVEAERRLRRKGVNLFAALVEEGNVASLTLCESMGYIPRRDIVYMRKKED